MKSILKLLSIASSSISDNVNIESTFTKLGKQFGESPNLASLKTLLNKRGGCYAFESCLRIYATSDVARYEPGILIWNHPEGWRSRYIGLPTNVCFFADDVFAGPFGFDESHIYRLNMETGKLSVIANSLDEWAKILLDNYPIESGWTAGHEWQIKNHPIRQGYKLLPKQPFSLGGSYGTENLTEVPSTLAMKYWARLYEQCSNTKPGEKVKVYGWLAE